MSSAVEFAYPAPSAARSIEDSLAKLSAHGGAGPVDFRGRLSALGELSRMILAPGSGLRDKLPREGLAFLASFLDSDFLLGQIARELKDVDSLSGFVRINARKSLRTVPKGLVCHWVAGNVPLLAVFSWAMSAVLGNRNFIRLSARQGDVLSPLLDALHGVSEAGARMADETQVVWFDRHNREAHEAMSRAADVRIAWGGREAVDAIRDLPAGWHCEDVIFGPRFSLAVVDPAFIDAGGIRRLATDVAVFDQLACSSPQHIFVKGARGSAGFTAFLEAFNAAFAQQSKTYPRHAPDFGETYRIVLDRARALLDGCDVFHDARTDWTVVAADAPSTTLDCANRFVQVIPFERVEDVYPHIPRNVQTVVTRLGPEDAEQFTEHAAHLGVCRFPAPGEGNHFENPWDGVGLVSRLTRSVVRTDPGD